jgi:hypothetical protein
MDLPNLQPEPGIKEMVKACERVTKDKEKKAWPKLKVGEAVRGQDPKSDIWEIGGTVTDLVHRGRSVFVEFYKGGSRLFKRANVEVDTTKKVRGGEEAGGGGEGVQAGHHYFHNMTYYEYTTKSPAFVLLAPLVH